MSGWNYRVVKRDEDPNPNYHWCAIHEIWYDDNGELNGWSDGPILPLGSYEDGDEGQKQLVRELSLMLKEAEKHPALSMKEIKAKFPEPMSRSVDTEAPENDDGGQ